MRIILFIALLSSFLTLSAQRVNIIPRPAIMEEKEGALHIKASEAQKWAEASTIGLLHTPHLRMDVSSHYSEMGQEGYTLEVTGEGVEIKAASKTGAFYAMQTLRQPSHPDAYSDLL